MKKHTSIKTLLISSLMMLVGITNAQVKESAEDILEKMSSEQKINEIGGVRDFKIWIFKDMLNQGLTNKGLPALSGGNKKLGIPELKFTDGHKGITAAGRWTAFPSTLLRGATFDKELEYKVGQSISTEAEAAGVTLFGGCTANLLRNPRGGRTEEAYSEDSYLTGELASTLVKGVQSSGKIMALGKHFAMNSIENNRFNVNAYTSERALMEVYLPQFRKMVEEGEIAALMSSYNKVNGTYCAENEVLLDHILRKQWGFDGFVISDWVNGTYSTAKSIKAGLNIEMPMKYFYSQDSILAAINSGQITWEDVDRVVLPILRKKLEYGENKAHKLDNTIRENNQALSQEVAEKGMVLLKNDKVLPFNTSKIKNILLVGELAKYHNLGEFSYMPDVPRSSRITPYKGIRNYIKKSNKNIALWYTDGKDKDEFEKLASRADAIVVCVGFTAIDEGENFHTSEGLDIVTIVGGGDRDNLNLHQDDINLINLTSRHSENVAVVLFGGGTPIVSQWIKRAPALLVGGIPGQNGGNALANILFGEVSPSGKLPYSIYENENDYPAFPNSHLQVQQPWEIDDNIYVDPFDVEYAYYLGYTLAEKENISVSFPFGYGLSYTQFEFKDVQTDKMTYSQDDVIRVKCTLKNTGAMEGGEVVQAYIGYEKAKVERPIKALKGFNKAYLKAGESKTVEVEIPVKDLAYWDVESKSWKVEKIDYIVYVGNSSKNEDLQRLKIHVE